MLIELKSEKNSEAKSSDKGKRLEFSANMKICCYRLDCIIWIQKEEKI